MEAGYPRADGKETKAGRRFDVLKFYSSQQGALMPVHKTMVMVAFTAAETEAHMNEFSRLVAEWRAV